MSEQVPSRSRRVPLGTSEPVLSLDREPAANTSPRSDSAVTEYRVFRLATATIVLHVLVDAFVAVEPGVSRVDHLARGLVPTAVAVLAAAFYPRLRAGARATIALLFGGLALVGAGIAIVDAAGAGPKAGDWTGFLLLPAGVALGALGIRLLWTSRKQEGRRFLRRSAIVVAAGLAVYWLVVPFTIALVTTHKPVEPVEAADLGRPYQGVTLRTEDGLDLRGWYVPARNGAAVIAFPGRSGPVAHARMLAANGYGVLLLDMRGQGESDGEPNAFGWGSAKDLDAAIAYLESRPDVEPGRIGGLGLSVGGELMIEAAALNPGLRAVVSEGAGWRSLNESLARSGVSPVQVWLQYPHDAVTTAAVAVLGGAGPPPSLEQLAARVAPRPVLFVYGEEGQGMEKALTPAYYDAAGEPKGLWQVENAGHTGGLTAQPREYERRIVAFFDEALLDR